MSIKTKKNLFIFAGLLLLLSIGWRGYNGYLVYTNGSQIQLFFQQIEEAFEVVFSANNIEAIFAYVYFGFTILTILLGLIVAFVSFGAAGLTEEELERHKVKYIVWGIVAIFLNLIAGIFILVAGLSETEKTDYSTPKTEEINKNTIEEEFYDSRKDYSSNNLSQNQQKLAGEIKKLKDLRRKGTLTQAEYEILLSDLIK